MKKFISIIFFSFITYTSTFNNLFADIKTNIIPTNQTVVTDTDWNTVIFNLLAYAKNFIFWVLMLIAIGVFLYIWFKLITAKWNQEEFKKALQTFVYAIVGLAFVWLAWALVMIVSSLNI